MSVCHDEAREKDKKNYGLVLLQLVTHHHTQGLFYFIVASLIVIWWKLSGFSEPFDKSGQRGQLCSEKRLHGQQGRVKNGCIRTERDKKNKYFFSLKFWFSSLLSSCITRSQKRISQSNLRSYCRHVCCGRIFSSPVQIKCLYFFKSQEVLIKCHSKIRSNRKKEFCSSYFICCFMAEVTNWNNLCNLQVTLAWNLNEAPPCYSGSRNAKQMFLSFFERFRSQSSTLLFHIQPGWFSALNLAVFRSNAALAHQRLLASLFANQSNNFFSL